jgi:hypothetical protein
MRCSQQSTPCCRHRVEPQRPAPGNEVFDERRHLICLSDVSHRLDSNSLGDSG